MNIYHKLIFIICIAIVNIDSVSSAEFIPHHDYPIKQCYEAKQGELNIDIGSYSNSLNNSYLLDCAVTATISALSPISGKNKSKSIRKFEKEKKIKIADFLLSKQIDINFKNEYGDTLLMSVISSFLPIKWKEKTIKNLINRGININEKNINGDIAMDLARYKGNANIIKMLSKKMEIKNHTHP